jgi:hypothetical protein
MGRLLDLVLSAGDPKAPEMRERNRIMFPFSTEKLDDLREQFGKGVRVVYAREGTHEVGAPLRPHEAGVQFSAAETSRSPGCECSSCTRRSKGPRGPGTEFGTDSHGRWKQAGK